MKLSFDEVMMRLVTAINIETGDDGTKAKQIVDTLFTLLKMSKKEYAIEYMNKHNHFITTTIKGIEPK